MNLAAIWAELPGVSQHVGGLVVNGLAVLGGAAVGWFGSGFLLQLLARFMTRKPVPRPALNLVRLLGAIALGWLVALLVFGTGGFGFGGPGGFGFGGGAGTNGKDKPADTAAKEDRREQPPTTGQAGPPPAAGGTLRVEVLGDARVREGRFYRVEGQPQLRSMDDLRTELKERRRRQPELQRLVLVIYEDSPDKDHPAVTDLMRWAKENELRVSLDFPKGKAP